MGVSYYSKAVIGIRVPPADFFVDKTVKTFDHDYPEDFTHDPKSGKKLWMTVREPRPDLNVPVDWEIDNGLNGFEFFDSTDSEETVLGIGCESGNWQGEVAFRPLPKDINTLKEELRQLLEPLGMWNEKAFGLYSVQYCSY